MLGGVSGLLRRIWRGAWRPISPLPSKPSWYHHADYWARRPSDFVLGAMIFLIPLAIGFLLYHDGSISPALLTVQVSLWVGVVLLAYCKGGDVPPAGRKANPR